jgi:hypothetical protein
VLEVFWGGIALLLEVVWYRIDVHSGGSMGFWRIGGGRDGIRESSLLGFIVAVKSEYLHSSTERLDGVDSGTNKAHVHIPEESPHSVRAMSRVQLQ